MKLPRAHYLGSQDAVKLVCSEVGQIVHGYGSRRVNHPSQWGTVTAELLREQLHLCFIGHIRLDDVNVGPKALEFLHRGNSPAGFGPGRDRRPGGTVWQAGSAGEHQIPRAALSKPTGHTQAQPSEASGDQVRRL